MIPVFLKPAALLFILLFAVFVHGSLSAEARKDEGQCPKPDEERLLWLSRAEYERSTQLALIDSQYERNEDMHHTIYDAILAKGFKLLEPIRHRSSTDSRDKRLLSGPHRPLLEHSSATTTRSSPIITDAGDSSYADAHLWYKYELHKQFGAGGFGEVWTAVRINRKDSSSSSSSLARDSLPSRNSSSSEDSDSDQLFVLKRIVGLESGLRLSGLREAYFGKHLRPHPHLVRFVESFEENDEIWLVFEHEGRPLSHLLYEHMGSTAVVSKEWRKVLQAIDWEDRVRDLVRPLLEALEYIHAQGVTHRDIKPSNILLKGNVLRLADFGSAVDAASLAKLFMPLGPSLLELSLAYAPPEVVLAGLPFDVANPFSYDIWSVGVLILEMLLGSNNVFRVSARTEAIIVQRFSASESGTTVDKAILLRALYEYCIFDPRDFRNFPFDRSLKKRREPCDERTFIEAVARHGHADSPNPARVSRSLGRFLLALLRWESSKRPRAGRAFRHAWLRGKAYVCKHCGREFDWKDGLQNHRCIGDSF